MDLITFKSLTGIEVLRIILMANIKNIVFVMHFGMKIDISDFPSKITKFHQNKLTPLRINILDTLIVTDKSYHSLKSKSLI